MKLIQKRAAVLLFFLFCIAGIRVSADQPASGAFYEEYGVWFDTNTGTVTGIEEGRTSLSIPEKIDGKTVLTIGEKAFYDNKTLKEAVLPDSVTKIETQAFAGCEGLEQIALSKKLVSIGNEAFLQCKKLSEISFPDSLERLGDSTFLGCSSLGKIFFPEKLKQIGEGTFSYCEQLTEISVPEKNQNYSSENGILFNQNKTKLIQYPIGKQGSAYTVPDTVTEIGNSGFAYSHLASVSLPDSLKTIGEFAFFDCDLIQELAVPQSVSVIGKEAFAWCDQLKKVVLPEGLHVLEYGLFWYSKNLNQVNLPASLTAISDYAFSRCESLEALEIPEGVRKIGEESFAYCSNLKRMILAKSTETVGKKAFYQCSSLEQITIKNGETVLGEQIFDGCGTLQFFTPEHSGAQQYAQNRGDTWEKIVAVTLQGRALAFDQPPVTRYDRTLVPVRIIFEAMGAQVSWEEETSTVTAFRDGTTLSLQIGNQTMLKNGEEVILDVPALQINDRTMVPVRAVAEGMDCDIYWDEDTQTVSIWEKEK